MKTRSFLSMLVLLSASTASGASVQSMYIDFGPGSGAPSSTYAAAAGVSGYWNEMPIEWDPTTSPWLDLLDIQQQPTQARFKAFNCDSNFEDFPSTTGDHQALLDDWFYGDCSYDLPTVQISGLQAGTYQLYVYPKGNGGAASLLVYQFLGGSVEGGGGIPHQGPFPGSYAGWDIDVQLLHVPSDGAFLDMRIWSAASQGIAGMQLLRLADSTSFCSGHLGGCPCSNVGAPLAGCPSSFSSSGASLVGTGTAHISNDTLQLTATNAGISLVILMQGTAAQGLGLGTLYGDGLRCVGGQLVRIASGQAAGGVFQYPVAGAPPLSVRGGVPATGGFRTYQLRYRNAASFCTVETFNSTNGVAVDWLP